MAESSAEARRFEKILEQYAQSTCIPGIGAAVIKDGRIAFCGGYGLAQVAAKQSPGPDTVFRYYSITKVYTATAIARLAAEGRIDLEADVRTYLPQVRFRHDFAEDPKVTLNHLLSHQSGFRREAGGPGVRLDNTPAPDANMEAQIPIFLKTPLSYKPGTDSSYSNMNYALLGAVIEAVTGEAYGDHMQRVLFDPLGLSRTASVYRPDMRVDSASGYMGSFSLMDWMLRLFYPAELREGLIVQDSWFGDKELGPFAFNAHGFGDLIGSVRDVAEFLRFHLDPGDPAFERILPKDWRERMRVNQGGSYAMSWALGRTDGAATFSHTGGGPGFSSYVCIVPSRGFGLALLGNRFTTTSPPLKEMMAAAGASSNNI